MAAIRMDCHIAFARCYAYRYLGSLVRELPHEDFEQALALAVVVGAGDDRRTWSAVTREILALAAAHGVRRPCRVPDCPREEVTLRRGRCSRCSRRAQRGGWTHLDPAGDHARYVAYVRARPASRLALARVGVPPGDAGARLNAMKAHEVA